jgi:hypothetical protein
MISKRILFSAVTLLSSLAGTVLAQGQAYFPNTLGLTWRFSNGETQKFIQPDTIKGVKVSILMHNVGGQIVQLDYLEYGKDGVFLRGSKVAGKITWYEPRIMIYPPAPLSAGLQWQSAGATDKEKKNTLQYIGRVVGQEPVENEAGRFNAFVIRSDITTSSGAATTVYTYFVPTRGTVRITTGDGSQVNLLK